MHTRTRSTGALGFLRGSTHIALLMGRMGTQGAAGPAAHSALSLAAFWLRVSSSLCFAAAS